MYIISLLTAHCSLLTAHCSLLTAHCSICHLSHIPIISLQIHHLTSVFKQENVRLLGLLDALKTGVILLTPKGDLHYANKSTKSLLHESDELVVNEQGLCAKLPQENSTLQHLIKSAIAVSQQENALDNHSNSVSSIAIISEKTNKIIVLTIVPFSTIQAWQGEYSHHDISVAIFLNNTSQDYQLQTQLLVSRYQLTTREVSLCEVFLKTANLEEVAQQSGLTLSSVRTYFKVIYQKTGQHSQAELMRFLIELKSCFGNVT